VTQGDRALGGYHPDAGLSGRQAAQVQKLPVPSLLRSLLSEHLDPGYAAAAAECRDRAPRGRAAEWGWQVLAAVAVATVFAVAAAQAQSVAPAARQTQQVLVGSVRASQAAADQATARRDALAAQVDTEQRNQLAGDERGQQLLAGLDQANFAAAVTRVTGPGFNHGHGDYLWIYPHTTENLADLAEWINPIVRGWMNYYGAFYRSELYGLLQRINTYLMRWARKKFKRLRVYKRCKTWWERLVQQQPDLFAHWAWMHAFSWAG